MCRPVHLSRVRTVTGTREPHVSRSAGQFVTAPILYLLLQRRVTEDIPCGRTLCPTVTSCWLEMLFMGVMLYDEPLHCDVIGLKLDRGDVELVGTFDPLSCIACSLFKHQSPSYTRVLFPCVVLGMLNPSFYRLSCAPGCAKITGRQDAPTSKED